MSDQSIAWAQKLARALERWCKENGIQPRNLLADELGIPRSIWQKVSAGNTVTKPEIYALVFHRTGLSEADPREIPARVGTAPGKPGNTYPIPRAWSEEQWQEFLGRQHKKAPPLAPSAAPTPSQHSSSTAGELFEQLIAEVAKVFASSMARQLAQELRETLQAEDVHTKATEAARQLLRELETAAFEGEEVLEALRRPGESIFLQLLPLLEMIIRGSERTQLRNLWLEEQKRRERRDGGRR